MLSDVLAQATERLDDWLADPERRERYDAKTLARADVLRAGLEALRGYLDVVPETSSAIDGEIAGDTQMLDTRIAEMEQEWRQQGQPNLEFSPSDFRRWAQAAAVVLRAIDEHLLPLLPEVQVLAPRKDNN
jgi:hypothetical protein